MHSSTNSVLQKVKYFRFLTCALCVLMCALSITQQASAQAVAARNGATTPHLRRITPIIPDANRFDPGKVFLENADALVADEHRSTEYRVLRGNVRFRRGDMTLRCDSAYFYEASSSLDAFGHVVMNQADTMTVYCDRMHYFGDVEVAKLRRNVRVVNSSMTVTTDWCWELASALMMTTLSRPAVAAPERAAATEETLRSSRPCLLTE